MENMFAMHYEILIRRAYNCGRYGRKGADADIFRALLREESEARENPTNKKVQARFQKTFAEVKSFTINALNQGIKRLNKMKASQDKIDIILKHISEVEKINSSVALAYKIEEALDSFIDLKIEMNYI